jgi:hypothetical protein
MAPNDFNKLLSRVPFRHLILHLSNGKRYEIRHPELAVVGLSVVWLHFSAATKQFLGERRIVVSLRHIVEIEFESHSPSGNGAITAT